MGKQIILPDVAFPNTLPRLLAQPPKTGLIFGIDPDALNLPDGTTIETLPDISGLNPAPVQSVGTDRPTLVHNILGTTGKGLRFDGGDNLILSGTALDLARNKTKLSVYALVSRDTGTTTAQDIFNLTTAAGSGRAALGGGATNNQLRAGARRLDADAQSTYVTSTDASYVGGNIVKLSAHYEWSASRIVLHLQSPSITRDLTVTLPAGAGSTSDTRSSAGYIGGQGTSRWKGDILSLLVYDSLDDDALTAAVRQFWLDRYGV